MRKTRRIISLVLALVFMFCFMAMSASAATIEVQPRGTCPSCVNGYVNTTTTIVSRDSNPYDNAYFMTTCSYMGAQHAHYTDAIKYKTTATCANCGYVETTYYWGVFCPYRG